MNTTQFDWITWAPSQYMKEAQSALAEKKTGVEAVKKIPASERTYENTLLAFERSGERLVEVWSCIEFLMNVKPDKQSREAAKAAVDFLQSKAIDLDYDEGMYRAIKELEARKPKLQGADKKLFKDTLLAYKRLGFELPKAKRDLVQKNSQALAKVSSDFRKNINDYEDHLLVTKEDLAGLPESYIEGLSKEKGKYKITLQYPDYIPFMENAVSEDRRAELSRKYLQKGGKKNMVVLQRMVQLRGTIAKLLGYPTHADYALDTKMAKNPKIVLAFLNGLIKPLRPKVKQEMNHLAVFKKELSGNAKAIVHPHDIAYLINQDKKRAFDLDDQLIREFFPLEIVTQGMFKIYETLFSVKFKPASIPVWHPDVKAFSVHEKTGNKLVAYFYLDMHPREGKYGHAAMFPLVPPYGRADGTYNVPVVGMVCNFTKPTKAAPSLLSHDEVETYFHEFGHVVHGMLTKARHISQSGTSVQRDFVEAPSQMLENWVWDEETLQLMSGHYQNTKKKLGGELLKNMLKAKMHMIAYTSMRQLTMGMFDMLLHTSYKGKDPAKLYAQLVKDYTMLALPKDQIFPAGFGHLEGYDAGYYGYMWSKVFAADMFTRFEKEGLLNPKTGDDYRRYILEPGSSKEEIELVKDFLERKPNNKAFLKEIGVK
ncbi:MAG: Zn-dependent oligopeptidase [bacterium]|nr:Zn-dependent oligopeptidase [bacterium]